MNEDEFCVCPYNSNHVIIRFRMPGHILKCGKNYRGPPLEQCIYNATHLVPEGTMASHLVNCDDCHSFNSNVYGKMAERYKYTE